MEPAADGIHPFFGQFLRLPSGNLVGGGLVAQSHDQIAVEDGGDGLAGNGQIHLEAGVLLKAREVQAGHGNVAVACPVQRLAQQMDVVGGAAAAAGLGDEQGGVIQVILAALQSVQKLADDQQGRVAGVVVHILQAQLRHLTAAVAQHFHMIALIFQRRRQHGKMQGQHVGNQDGVGLFHLLSKTGIIGFHRVIPPFVLFRPVQQTGCGFGCLPHPGW